ncbi:helix-turn-helix domain-containing protein [Methylocella silvestris]|uniref:DNA-binding protein n=1 Tax=Methylocella silvestris TaxID=199596 RepID=A0A2J7TD42_METSI|nr:helix-turn-helix domain-containing protein [Methylocella silvestris]PNG24678.1 DNA-binding protein [Methylocella silvestris]
MARRPPSCRGVNRHRNYTVDEAARARGVGKATVRRWLKRGLPSISDHKPLLILGADLAQFWQDRQSAKQTCKLHECFCFACRAPKAPAADMVEFVPLSASSGNLRALCCDCTRVMHKRVSLAKLPELQAILDVTIRQAPERIREMTDPSTNEHLLGEPQTHA